MPINHVDVRPLKDITKKKIFVDVVSDGKVGLDKPVEAQIYRDKVSWYAIFYKYIPEAVNLSGMKYAFNPTEVRWRRTIWMLVLLTGVSVLTQQITDRIRHYLSTPVSVDVVYEHQDSVPFPSVAICNINAFNSSQLRDPEMREFLEEWQLGDHLNISRYQSVLSSYEMTDMYYNFSHLLNETVLSVHWNQEILNHSVMTMKMTDWGICFVFNDIDNGEEGLVVTNAGSSRGLEIFLDAHQAEYFFQPTAIYGAGFKVLLYDRGTEPVIEGKSFAIATGVQTWVNNLEEPYGQCSHRTLNHFANYSYVACETECLSEFLIGQCGCKTLAMTGEARECTAYQYFSCISPNIANYTSEGCDCPMACFSRQYVESVSFSNFPSDFMASIIAESYSTTPSNVQKNMCAVNIFMKDLSVQKISQQADYSVASLMSDIGGSLGLWLGGSVLTVFEIVDLIGYSAYVHSRKIPQKTPSTS
ncbi:acid-sensing ion channel 1-like [Diadema antillarum]|uniref:acid-sensing ion channel 1-like n=1 Tax=Diadema antillarum TaxID=105358 RepID=UPI003A89D301